ncbi:MAG: RnfABCDGE type electron transport complex subunit D [Chromatiales bacterium]
MTKDIPVEVISSPHLHGPERVALMMRQVLIALAPGIAVQTWVFGVGVLVQLALAVIAGFASEALMLAVRRQALRLYLADGSVCVTAALFAMAMPPLAPWWLTVVGMTFAVVVAKHAYGGLGYNVFNPAMAGYALLLVCFPYDMTQWPLGWKSLAPAWAHIFGVADESIDAVAGATALEYVRSELQGMKMLSELAMAPALGHLGGHGSEWINAAYLLGGLWLWIAGVIRWQIPAGFLGGLFFLTLAFHLRDADHYAPPLFHLFSGATMIGAFFIATDPVSSPVAPTGRLVFGLATGMLVSIIRIFGVYPDGVAFAVLIMNAAAPLIDRYTRPRVLGEQRR